IRVARKLTQGNHDPESQGTLSHATLNLVCDDFHQKAIAVGIAARRCVGRDAGIRFTEWLHLEVVNHAATATELLTLAKGARLSTTSDPTIVIDPPAISQLQSLATELLGYGYFAATLIQFFAETMTDDLLREALGLGDPDAPGFIEILAQARLMFASS